MKVSFAWSTSRMLEQPCSITNGSKNRTRNHLISSIPKFNVSISIIEQVILFFEILFHGPLFSTNEFYSFQNRFFNVTRFLCVLTVDRTELMHPAIDCFSLLAFSDIRILLHSFTRLDFVKIPSYRMTRSNSHSFSNRPNQASLQNVGNYSPDLFFVAVDQLSLHYVV